MFTSKLRSRKAHQQIQHGRKLLLEGLETRNLMAANLTATLDTADKVLRIEGTSAADSIVVRNSSGRVSVNGINIQVNNNGSLSNPSSVARNLVTRVEVVGLGGNDVISMNETGMTAGQGLPLHAWGGNGNDKLTGGSMIDKLYGENGSDTLIGNGGADHLYGAFAASDVETGGANDILIGNAGNDLLRGGAGNDDLSGGTENDHMLGCAGNDRLAGGGGADSMNGGSGFDTLQGVTGFATLSDTEFKTWQNNAYTSDTIASFEKATLTASDVGLGYTYLDAGNFTGAVVMTGTALPDYFYGGAGSDTLSGLDGNDYLVGYGGDDVIDSGLGDDMIGGGQGVDTLTAGDGSDTFFASNAYALLSDTVFSYWSAALNAYVNSALFGFEKASLYAVDEGLGYTFLSAENFSGPVTLIGSSLTDYLYGGAYDDSIYSYGGNDVLRGNSGNDLLAAGDGADSVSGGYGNDTVYAGADDDRVYGEDGSDVLYGEGGNDIMYGAYSSSTTEWGNDMLFGGTGNDWMSAGDGEDLVYGEDGDDTLIGDNGRDKLFGGWGNDGLWGGAGNDRLAGEYGDDTLVGDDGNDEIIGGQGLDKMWGAAGDDSLVAIDGGTTDEIVGNEGRDTMWIDGNWNGGFSFSYDTRWTDSSDTVQTVFGFANGADRSLNGDAIADPTDATNQKNFSSNWLFADWGPTASDVDQEDLGDCWLMASMGAVAADNPSQIREIVADFGDGTYGVKLGGSFYRVDADLSTWSASSTDQRFAGLGQQNSLWVALIEKAYTMHTGENTYASINGGYATNALSALGLTSVNSQSFSSSTNDADVANKVFTHWNSYQNVVVDVFDPPAGSPLVGSHSYTVISVTRDSSGNVTSIRLRNPWGGDNTSGNPYVDVTPAQLGACGTIRVCWGNA